MLEVRYRVPRVMQKKIENRVDMTYIHSCTRGYPGSDKINMKKMYNLFYYHMTYAYIIILFI